MDARTPRPVKDAHCNSCGFVIGQGVYAYMAGSYVFCQKCVRGPYPYGVETNIGARYIPELPEIPQQRMGSVLEPSS